MNQFKKYSNPEYEHVPEDWWTAGLCSIFANALRERCGMQLYAIVERAESDGDETLCHVVGVKNGIAYDANGSRPLSDWSGVYRPGTFYPDEPSAIVIRPVTPEELSALHDEDVEATNAAHRFIERHSNRFPNTV